MPDALVKLFERLDWPVLQLELRRSRKQERGFFWAVVVAMVVGFIGLICTPMFHQRSFRYGTFEILVIIVYAVLKFAFPFVIVPSYCSRVISGERETLRFDHLCLTPVQSAQIILQKVAVPAMYALVAGIALLPCDFIDESEFNPVWWFMGATFVNMGIATLCSCLFAKTRTSTAVTYAIVLLGPLLAVQFLMILSLSMGGSHGYRMMDDLYRFLFGPGGAIVGACVGALLLYLSVLRLESLRRGA